MDASPLPQTIALAAFVKTASVSPVKTRLAKDFGREAANEFYALSHRAVMSVMRASEVWRPYWAVAEEDTHAQWPDFPCIWQGEGGLGERLAKISATLFAEHEAVIFIGADCPQIHPGLLLEALDQLRQAEFVIGPANDGGFYLLAAKKEIPRPVWLDVPYSDDATCREIVRHLQGYGKVVELEALTDADHLSDLPQVLAELRAVPERTPQHAALLTWMEERLGAS
jgi:rSAM/selenodomain-associated transferase 1